MNPITTVLALALGAAGVALGNFVNLYLGAAVVLAAVIVGLALKMANTWEKFVIRGPDPRGVGLGHVS